MADKSTFYMRAVDFQERQDYRIDIRALVGLQIRAWNEGRAGMLVHETRKALLSKRNVMAIKTVTTYICDWCLVEAPNPKGGSYPDGWRLLGCCDCDIREELICNVCAEYRDSKLGEVIIERRMRGGRT